MVWGSGCASAVTQTVLSKHPDVSAEALCQGKNLDWSPRGLPTFLADFQLFHLKVYQERRVIITDKRQLWVAKNGFSMCFGCLPHFSLWIFLCDEVQFQITVWRVGNRSFSTELQLSPDWVPFPVSPLIQGEEQACLVSWNSGVFTSNLQWTTAWAGTQGRGLLMKNQFHEGSVPVNICREKIWLCKDTQNSEIFLLR